MIQTCLEKRQEGWEISVSNGYFMNVEIKDDGYFSIFPKMLTINTIYFCNQEENKTNNHLEWKYFICKLCILSLGPRSKPLSWLLCFDSISPPHSYPDCTGVYANNQNLVKGRLSKTFRDRTELKVAQIPCLRICYSN